MHNNQDEEQLIIFRVGPVVCSVVSRLVESIVDNQPLHRFPGQASFILGVLHYRDHAVSIVNLFNKFDFPEPKTGPDSCFIMGNTIYGTVGFWVDEVLEVTTQYKLHQTNLPAYAGANVFDCALLWSDQIVLQTDLNCLFTMNESAPLQNWIQQDENHRIPANQNSGTETSGQSAWNKAANEASKQEIHSLMSRGAQLSKMIEPSDEQLPDSIEDSSHAWRDEEEVITVSPLTEISETIITDVNADVGVDTSGQLKFIFQSRKHTNTKRELRVNTKNIEEPLEQKTTLKAIAEQHGDIDSVKLDQNHFDRVKNSAPSKKEFVNPIIKERKTEKKHLSNTENTSSLIFEKISARSGSSFLDTTQVVSNVVKKETSSRHDKKQEYEIEKLNPNSLDSDVYDNFENDWDTLMFTSALLDDETGEIVSPGQEEFSVLSDDESVDMYDDAVSQRDEIFHKRNDAVERVAKRIQRRNEGENVRSPFRIAASILIVAVIVFVIQSQWLNSDLEKTVNNVPSLQLLKEKDGQEARQKEVSINTITDKYVNEHSIKLLSEEKLASNMRYEK